MGETLPDVGLVLAALLFGLRHGADWDHIAAITDITATQDSPRRGAWYGTLYALGHALVVFALGVLAILVGSRFPGWVDAVMGRVVGVTLLALGVYVTFSLVRHGSRFRLQSRWMLVIRGMRRLRLHLTRFRHAPEGRIDHSHPHAAVADLHHEGADGRSPATARTHSHRHSHAAGESYGPGTAVTIGALHGIGAETPTQVLVFLAAAGAGGSVAGIAVLVAFLVGLLGANTAITVGSAWGFVSAARHPRLYVGLASVTAVVSLGLGALYVAGVDAALPLIGG